MKVICFVNLHVHVKHLLNLSQNVASLTWLLVIHQWFLILSLFMFCSRHVKQRTENCDIPSAVQLVLWLASLRNRSQRHLALSDSSIHVSIH